ncbi:MAG TPA: lamin tail domain-containing protein [Chloroflexia bacterium]|nr:lamin tail domain-containing protein [Chloroflexia bacterium]
MPEPRARETIEPRRAGATNKLVLATGCLLALCAALSLLLLPTASSQAQFAHPAFQATWARTDGLVASGSTKRPWVWGPVPGRSVSEPFQGFQGNAHLVQYFDKGRMEVNNPSANQNDPFFVTNGLLSVELISGLMQTGPASYQNRGPAQINLASDADDPTAPTYQSFNGVSNVPGAPNERRKQAQIGQVVRQAIDRQGITQPWPANHGDYGVRIAQFEPATGHNIPDVFWEYLNQQTDIVQGGQRVTGPLFYPWFAVTGYPISEPYWSYVKVEGSYTDVLIQAFERRVLTFVPHLPSPFKVQMGNIGMHYYEWRYSPAQATPRPGGPTPTSNVLPPKANITIDEIAYRKSITDLNGNYVVLTNRAQTGQSLNGWWIDSPKWSYVDRFYFPARTLAAGASVRVHAGAGNDTPTDFYMNRTSLMWEGEPYDLAVLYDNFGREVDRFFPAAEVGVPPTAPPAATPPGQGTALPTATVAAGGTPQPTSTLSKGTSVVPTPESTAQPTIVTGRTPTLSGSVTVTPTGVRTGTPTITPTRTPTP